MTIKELLTYCENVPKKVGRYCIYKAEEEGLDNEGVKRLALLAGRLGCLPAPENAEHLEVGDIPVLYNTFLLFEKLRFAQDQKSLFPEIDSLLGCKEAKV